MKSKYLIGIILFGVVSLVIMGYVKKIGNVQVKNDGTILSTESEADKSIIAAFWGDKDGVSYTGYENKPVIEAPAGWKWEFNFPKNKWEIVKIK